MFEFEKMYCDMKERKQKQVDYMDNWSTNIMTLAAMFEYDGLPESIDTDYIELYLITHGCIGFGKIGEKLTAFIPSRTGDIDAYNQGTELNGATPIGDFHGVIGQDCIIGNNNILHLPDFDTMTHADIMSEIETSIKVGVKTTRSTQVMSVADRKAKAQAESIIQKSLDGVPKVITSEGLSTLNGAEAIRLLDLSDVGNSDKLQYLIQVYEDLQRLFYRKYGHNIQGTAKRAQASVEEVEGADSVSFILPLDRLKHRQKMIDELNNMFGLSASVKFSETWEQEYHKYMKCSESGESVDIDIEDEDEEGDEDNE